MKGTPPPAAGYVSRWISLLEAIGHAARLGNGDFAAALATLTPALRDGAVKSRYAGAAPHRRAPPIPWHLTFYVDEHSGGVWFDDPLFSAAHPARPGLPPAEPARVEVDRAELLRYWPERMAAPPRTRPTRKHELGAKVVPFTRRKRGRRGPRPGAVSRYRKQDEALLPELEAIVAAKQMSHWAAALELAQAGRITGLGNSTPESRAKRLLAVLRNTKKPSGAFLLSC